MMANISRRDRAIAAVAGAVLLYGIAAAFWFMGQEQAWKTAAKKYSSAAKKVASEKRLIGERQKWYDAYEEEREKMPVFQSDAKDIDTHWLSRMDAIAQESHVSISQRQAGNQIEAGDVFELPIDVKRWDATITTLVKFMHSLETEKEAMFDIREISIKPSSNKGFLSGSFKLACAYMKAEES